MTLEEPATHIVHGHVKWFDPAKGFGFIVSNEAESDILLHANVLRNYGQNSVSDGAMITVRVQQSPRGAQAVEVVSVQAPAGAALPLADEGNLMSAEDIAALALEPSRVKWFDKAKGFGFANVFGRNDDVFIHVEVLRMSGFADLQAGEAVCLRIIEGKRGRMAVQVASWEAAARTERG
ncbi:cold shock domain-containing protein [Pseudotabrizicola sediminis]|uniref:Cold shock domain-containing protein n=1 Tax=Pseudotabrizicola sediminis TaxID=2486418 RepID=A0ABY2KJR7_9RHOB|nr:cold shock domain-containing protein [Pseudotabrizicola sediminis]TGD42680.1 cold shock domain-containing protein [Pseudotabrizicola sediminis]TGD63623.1 cold shock domain-containing protein [Tabrizicola sp. WMC-M-20]